AGRGDDVENTKRLLRAIDSCRAGVISGPIQQSLTRADMLPCLAAAMTILLTDYGGTTPSATCEAGAEAAPPLYRPPRPKRVLAACKEIQQSEVQGQSALFQDLFRTFNVQYFAGRLPDYKVLLVYDVGYWERERCGYPPVFPPAFEASGFIDFSARQIFIR